MAHSYTEEHIQRLIDLGAALSSERDQDILLEKILLEAKSLTNADGGTLYLIEEVELTAEELAQTTVSRGAGRKKMKQVLSFAIMRTDSLNIAKGGSTGVPVSLPPLSLVDANNQENHRNVATHVALTGNAINIANAYEEQGFDFSGTKKFDEFNHYRSKSFLTVPLKDHQDEVIGVLQLLNSRARETDEIVSFDPDIEPIILSLASQAAIKLNNLRLIMAQRELLDSFIKLIAGAIDQKSPYTGGHCQRVPVITEMLARAACRDKVGTFRDFDLNEEEWYELHIAAWLHDCGKVTTPEFVVDKATKLETKYDRIHEISIRFEVMKRDAELRYMRGIVEAGADKAEWVRIFQEQCDGLDSDMKFLRSLNASGEFLHDSDIARLYKIAERTWVDSCGQLQPCLNENEVYNLEIRRGTLTSEERQIINDHVVTTIQMLESLPFPRNLSRVPEYAGGHHERMDGQGYPNGLTREEMSIPARMMAIADIFEALTARDRPYKQAKKISESLRIMSFMCAEHHIDPDLYKLFLEAGVFREYSTQYLLPDQLDSVDVNELLQIADLVATS